MTRWALIGITALSLSGLLATVKLDAVETGAAMATDSIERGRYLVKIGGCNDCHTPGYLEKAGNVPEDRWLIGDSLGFNGPWGTTYPTNLRQLLRTMGEDDWCTVSAYSRGAPAYAVVQPACHDRGRPARHPPICAFAARRRYAGSGLCSARSSAEDTAYCVRPAGSEAVAASEDVVAAEDPGAGCSPPVRYLRHRRLFQS